MKIKSLNISAFGGIKNLELTTDNRFNIIYGDNENGKTTIMNFIKMMFYGTERSSAQLSKNPRKKYTPWDGSIMAGSIDFENGGRSYRLERIFGSSNSTDKVTLSDLSFGTRENVSADIGAKLFGISAAAFERSIFIGQFGFPESNDIAVGELNGKLSNIASTGDESISFDMVNKRLLDAKYELMSKSGKSGIYDKNLKLEKELSLELEKSLSALKTIETTTKTIDDIVLEIKNLKQRADYLKVQIDSENDVRNAQKLQELLRLKQELDTLNKSLTLSDGSLADEMFVRKVEFCLSKLQNINAKISAKQNENTLIENNLKLALNPVSNATPENAQEIKNKIAALESELDSISQKIEQLENCQTKKPNSSWFILSAITAALSGGMYLFNPIITFIGIIAAAIFISVGTAGLSKHKSNVQKRQNEILDLKLKQNSIISVIASEKSNLNAINTALNSTSAMLESQKELLKKGTAELTQLINEHQSEKAVLLSLFSPLKQTDNLETIKETLSEIKLKADTQKELKQNINYILKDIGNISYTEAQQKLSQLKGDTDTDFNVIKAEYESILQSITDKKTSLASLTSEVKAISSRVENPENIKTELEILNKKIQSQKDYCDCLDLVLDTLADSYAEVRQSYGSELEKTASEIFSGLTAQRYKNMSISKSFDIAVNKTNVFGSRELEYLSSGTVDQAYLSLRLALTRLMSQKGSCLPIILDDALAQYDDQRTKTALEFLNDYAKDGQIIMFTCHNSVVNLSKDLDVNVITL